MVVNPVAIICKGSVTAIPVRCPPTSIDKILAINANINIVPVIKGTENFASSRFIGANEVAQSGIRENNAPTKGVIRLVALDHGDVVRGVEFFHQQGEIQSGWPATDAYDLHGISLKPEYFKPKVIVKAMKYHGIGSYP